MSIRKSYTIILILLASVMASNAQTARVLQPACDSISKLLLERTGVKSTMTLKRVTKRGSYLDLRFNRSAGDYPWRDGDEEWLKKAIIELAPESCKEYKIGRISVESAPLSDYVMPSAGNNGKPVSKLFRTDKDPRPEHPFIEEKNGMKFNKGLSGRNIALWQSHGRYYDEKSDRWEWQRAPVMQTVEDLYTQSYVLPFLIPMLENAGAYVMTPRERDTQTNEIITDNDPSFGTGWNEGMRTEGEYSEKGDWEDLESGFADAKPFYTGLDNPFKMGTARQIRCSEKGAEAKWTPMIQEAGSYSVYISYKTVPHSTPCAHYTVRYRGGEKEFYVNQRMGGGTWIYLGTFEFERGDDAFITLDADVPEDRDVPNNAVLTADAVRLGGGMGKIARGQKDRPIDEYEASGMPSYTEGALYWMQWAGVDSTILTLHDDDYTSDYADRGAWVSWMSGGSRTNPKGEGLGIPIDLSFAFHTDAGTTPNDSIIGTLAIYTLKAEEGDKLPNGESRLQSRMLCDFTQTQIVDDIRSQYEPEWARRELWDRSYSESRTTNVPAMLLELLSHQNFADMKYGLDPSFRFTVSRAVYKGILKYLSNRYGFDYAVQPLPVRSFATSITNISGSGKARVKISWRPSKDSLESTADPSGYILYTRIDDYPFDGGIVVSDTCAEREILPGHIYSYKVVAFNEGGKSFPSEVLSVGVPHYAKAKNVIVVNNFTRVAPPAWFDTPEYAGFNNELDAGVPYMQEINFIGSQYEFRRGLPWVDDDNPGFGASYTDHAGKVVIGNTFDYTIIHGRAIMAAGYPFHSVSVEAFCSDSILSQNDFAIDLICGKQITTMKGSGRRSARFQVFPRALQAALTNCTAAGKNLIVTGSDIGTDVWDKIYPLQIDSVYTADTKTFVEKVLGYSWMTNHATRNAHVKAYGKKNIILTGDAKEVDFYNTSNDVIYSAGQVDGIIPSSGRSSTFMRYSDSNISAGVCLTAKGYKTACIGFPFETIKEDADRNTLMSIILEFFDKR